VASHHVIVSGFYALEDDELPRRAALAAEVRRLFAVHRGTYGSPPLLAATADVLRGIAETRRTLTQQMVADFEQDIIDFARV
jgi:hypothetical protein